MINVYYNLAVGDDSMESKDSILAAEPELVISDLAKTQEGIVWDRYRQCPAGMDFFKNLFLVRAVGNVTFNHFNSPTDGPRLFTDRDEGFRNSQIYVQEYEKKNQIIQLLWYYTFFADKDLEVSVMPAFFHSNNFTKNTVNLPGKYNINKWFRPTQPGFMMKENEVKIKYNDPIYYLKFHTDEKINFKKFSWNDSLATYLDECLSVKETALKLGMKKLYNMFLRNKFDKKIINELERNIVKGEK